MPLSSSSCSRLHPRGHHRRRRMFGRRGSWNSKRTLRARPHRPYPPKVDSLGVGQTHRLAAQLADQKGIPQSATFAWSFHQQCRRHRERLR
jgi:hypothetical protein